MGTLTRDISGSFEVLPQTQSLDPNHSLLTITRKHMSSVPAAPRHSSAAPGVQTSDVSLHSVSAPPELRALWVPVPFPSAHPPCCHKEAACPAQPHPLLPTLSHGRFLHSFLPLGLGPRMPAAHTACVTALSISSGAVLSPRVLACFLQANGRGSSLLPQWPPSR